MESIYPDERKGERKKEKEKNFNIKRGRKKKKNFNIRF